MANQTLLYTPNTPAVVAFMDSVNLSFVQLDNEIGLNVTRRIGTLAVDSDEAMLNRYVADSNAYFAGVLFETLQMSCISPLH